MKPTRELVLPKVAVPARIALAVGRELAAELFVTDLPHAGRSELLDALALALDGDAAFVPAHTADGVRLVAKRAIAWIAIRRDEPEGEMTLYDRQHHVTIDLAGGGALSGMLFDSSPADRPRVIDHLNSSRRFVRLWTTDEHYLINRDHIVQVAEHPGRSVMPKIDAYLKSIEKFGAAGAVLTSGQPVTLRFPTGDRHATQVTPHDQLVVLVREVAPPNVLDQIDQQRPARFEYDAAGTRYALAIAPRPGSWQVTIEPAPAPAPPPSQPPPPARAPRTAAVAPDASELTIERGQYDDGSAARPTTSGSPMLDALTAAARSARATDVILSTGAAPAMRIDGRLRTGDRPLDAETISRELGIVAPGDARAAWTEHGTGLFTYGDGIGRVRVALGRDHRGPAATLRLLAGEPPALERLALGREVAGWLDQRGLVIVAGASGSGKTTTLAALVRALGERKRRVVAIEDPIEILHPAEPLISQRAVGEHVASVAAGVAAAICEGADAIAVGSAASAEAAAAVVEAVAAGHLVLTTLSAGAGAAAGQLCELVGADRRDHASRVVGEALLGTIAVVTGEGGRSYDVHPGSRV